MQCATVEFRVVKGINKHTLFLNGGQKLKEAIFYLFIIDLNLMCFWQGSQSMNQKCPCCSERLTYKRHIPTIYLCEAVNICLVFIEALMLGTVRRKPANGPLFNHETCVKVGTERPVDVLTLLV